MQIEVVGLEVSAGGHGGDFSVNFALPGHGEVQTGTATLLKLPGTVAFGHVVTFRLAWPPTLDAVVAPIHFRIVRHKG